MPPDEAPAEGPDEPPADEPPPEAQGAPPAEVAGLIIDAIRTEQYLVPTRPSYAEQLQSRTKALVDKALPPMAVFD